MGRYGCGSVEKYYWIEILNKQEELEEIRDPRRFFEVMGTARGDLKVLSDQCKQLDSFVYKSLTEYRNIKQIFDDNRENLAALSDGHGEKLTWLIRIEMLKILNENKKIILE